MLPTRLQQGNNEGLVLWLGLGDVERLRKPFFRQNVTLSSPVLFRLRHIVDCVALAQIPPIKPIYFYILCWTDIAFIVAFSRIPQRRRRNRLDVGGLDHWEVTATLAKSRQPNPAYVWGSLLEACQINWSNKPSHKRQCNCFESVRISDVPLVNHTS